MGEATIISPPDDRRSLSADVCDFSFVCVPLSTTSPSEGRGSLRLLTACTHHVAQRLVCSKVTRIFLPSYSLAIPSTLGFYYLMVFSLPLCQRVCVHTHARTLTHSLELTWVPLTLTTASCPNPSHSFPVPSPFSRYLYLRFCGDISHFI